MEFKNAEENTKSNRRYAMSWQVMENTMLYGYAGLAASFVEFFEILAENGITSV